MGIARQAPIIEINLVKLGVHEMCEVVVDGMKVTSYPTLKEAQAHVDRLTASRPKKSQKPPDTPTLVKAKHVIWDDYYANRRDTFVAGRLTLQVTNKELYVVLGDFLRTPDYHKTCIVFTLNADGKLAGEYRGWGCDKDVEYEDLFMQCLRALHKRWPNGLSLCMVDLLKGRTPFVLF